MNNKFPFVSCLHPQRIRKESTGEWIVVPCGHCESCCMRKASINTLKCDLETRANKFTKFVTLTYSDENIPRFEVCGKNRWKDENGIVHDDFTDLGLFVRCPRLSKIDGTCIGEYKGSTYPLANLIKKVDNQYFPFLFKPDVQNFMKRLRKRIQKYAEQNNITDSQVRYYAVGEYGPVHFRPHYHLILWCQNAKINSKLPLFVRASWRLGRVSTETPRSSVSSYVAKYVNSNCRLPRIYKQDETKPFALHSFHLGEMVLQKDREEVYECSYDDFVTRCHSVADTNKEFSVWRSLKDYYFPRCKSYDVLTSQQRLFAYTIAERAFNFAQREKLSEVTQFILEYLNWSSIFYGASVVHHHFCKDEQWNDMLSFFVSVNDISPSHIFDSQEYYKRCYRQIYMMLRLSWHFIHFVCGGEIRLSSYFLNKIEKFWKEDDYHNLKNNLQCQEEYFVEYVGDEEDYMYNYYNFSLVDFENSVAYRKFQMQTKSKFENSIKHKKLNDLNKVFENK